MIRAEVWFSFAGTKDLLTKRRLARELAGETARMVEATVEARVSSCCMTFTFPSLAAWNAAKAALAAGGFRFSENE